MNRATWTPRAIRGGLSLAVVVFLSLAGRPVAADEVQFKNGDRLTGTIQTLDDGKLKIKSAVAGEVTVDMKDVKTFSTDGPVELRLADGTVLKQPVGASDIGQVALKGGGAVQAQKVPLSQVKKINPNERFTGAITVGGLLTRGNSDTEQLNVAIDLARRTETDRITLGAGYLFGRERDKNTGDKTTTTDNWFVAAKYDYFFNPKFYAFGAIRLEKDRIANLDQRITPSGGLGYQWVDRPTLHFNTEAGLAYVYESFSNDGTDEHVAARLAYHVDAKVNDQISVFHNLIFLPSVEELRDYNLIVDGGVRAALTEQMFSELKVQWNYDSIPAPGASRSDLRYILGVGWKF